MAAIDELFDRASGAATAGKTADKSKTAGKSRSAAREAKNAAQDSLSAGPKLRTAAQRLADQRVITIRGAREHNLKNVDLTIPRDKLVVFTGLSGSGKSSLAFDTIYAEGQRRYVESRCRPMPASSWR